MDRNSGLQPGSGFLHARAIAGCAGGNLDGGLNLGLSINLGLSRLRVSDLLVPELQTGSGDTEGGKAVEEAGGEEELGGFYGSEEFYLSAARIVWLLPITHTPPGLKSLRISQGALFKEGFSADRCIILRNPYEHFP